MNGSYTVWDNPAVDRFVNEQLRRITDSLVELLSKDIEAVVLSGGFGRCEGSVCIDVDGSMHVVNDYDLEVVYRRRGNAFLCKLLMHARYRKKLDKLAEKLADELHLKQIDFGLCDADSYASITEPKLADFDSKHGHKLLYGSADPLALMPEFRPADIPLFEGTWLLRNRGIGLLLARLYLDNGVLPEAKRENFYIEINKAVLATGDALFISNGNYVCSYAERAGRFHEFAQTGFEHMQELLRLYPLAAEYKLKPRDIMYPGMSPAQLWDHINQLYGSFFLFHESHRLKSTFRNLDDYAEWASRQPALGFTQRCRLMLERIAGYARGCPANLFPLKRDKPRNVAFTLSLLACLKKEGIDNVHVKTAYKLLGENRKSMTIPEWRELARDFLLLVHPTGEVGKFLADHHPTSTYSN